jgi:hypothetical protein
VVWWPAILLADDGRQADVWRCRCVTTVSNRERSTVLTAATDRTTLPKAEVRRSECKAEKSDGNASQHVELHEKRWPEMRKK